MEELQPEPIKQKLVHRQLFKDRKMVVLGLVGILMGVITSIRVLLNVHRYEIDIPIIYTEFGGAESYITGSWTNHYSFVFFAIIITVLNTLLALRIYQHRRWVGVLILSMQIMIMVFLFIVSRSIIGTLPVAG